ncbi:hypothetical protein HZB60_04195 [candidate division KSB1 bacterium]|nr:hypothetical protein [candidate division KSB1 bacterium]
MDQSTPFIATRSGNEITQTPGVENIRLYSPSSASVLVSGTYLSDGAAEYIGTRTDNLVEVLTFSGSKSAALSKGYGIASNAKVVNSTPFIGGGSPSQTERGLWEGSTAVYGALVVEYEVSYKMYRVKYGVPQSAITDMFDNGKAPADLLLPPVLVMAFASGGYGAMLTVDRRVGSNIDTGCGSMTELSRKTKKVRVSNPDDSAQWIDQDVVIERTMQCSNGDVLVFRYNE